MKKILQKLDTFFTSLGNMVIYPFEKLFHVAKRTKKERKKVALISGISVLILAPAIILSLMNAGEVIGAWYDNSWDHRKPVTISYTGSTLSNYDVIIEFDTATLISEGKMQADCDDIRVTDSDETTLITYWLEGGCNTTTTQIWADVPSIPDGGKTIYVYYNNPSAVNGEASWSGVFKLMYDSTCPTGWTQDSDYDSRFQYGASSYGTTGGGSHSHAQVSCSHSYSQASNPLMAGNDIYVVSTHNHSHSGIKSDISSTTALPPYLDMVVCKKNDLVVPAGLIAYFDSSTPTGWTRFTALDGKFPRGATSYGGTGGADTHSHSTTGGYTTSSGANTAKGELGTSRTTTVANHTHTSQSGTSGSGTNTPPFLEMVVAEKNSEGAAPSGIIVKTDSLPPLGWTRFTALDAKLPKGAASYGGTGGSSTHTHSVTTSTGGTSSVTRHGGASNTVLSAGHTHSCSATTDSQSNLPPYIETIFAKRNNPAGDGVTTSVGAEKSRNTPPDTPTLDSPADTATNQVLTPALKTTGTDSVEGDWLRYKIDFCENEAMTTNCQTFDQTSSQTGWSGQNTQSGTAYTSGTQATYTIQSDLSTATTYYWRSYATDPEGSTDWSATQGTPYSFTTTTAPSAPSTPHAEGQVNPSAIIDLTPEFSAIHSDPDVDDAIYYEIEVNTASGFDGTSMWDTGKTSMPNLSSGSRSTDRSYAGTSLSYDGSTYYWRIRFWDNKGAISPWSSTQNFSVNNVSNTPSLDSPLDLATNVAVSTVFKTTSTDPDSDYLRYKINVCTNEGMTENCVTYDQTSSQTGWSGQDAQTGTAYASGTQATYTVQTPLAGSTIYYWRTYSKDPAGSNTWSSTQSSPYQFTTTDGPPRSTNCVIRETDDDSQFTIEWVDNSSDELGYEIQKEVNGGGFSLLQDMSPSVTSYVDTDISNDNSYRYRVAPYYAGPLYGTWCYTATLTLGIGTFSFENITFD